jgi:hypothetical protein
MRTSNNLVTRYLENLAMLLAIGLIIQVLIDK